MRNTNRNAKTSPVAFVLAVAAMAAVVMNGDRIHSTLRSTGAELSAVQTFHSDGVASSMNGVQPVRAGKALAIREFNVSAHPMAKKQADDWATDEAIQRQEQARSAEDATAKALEDHRQAIVRAQLEEQAMRLQK